MEERRALTLIARDLAENEASLRHYSQRLVDQERAGARFFRHLESGGTDDSLAVALQGALAIWNYRPALPAYRGISESGRLHLIREPTLRDSIIAHYDETIQYLDDLRARVASRNERALELLQRHMTVQANDSAGWRLTLTSSPSELKADKEALSALAHAVQSKSWLRFRIGQIFLPEDEKLRRAIEQYLE